MTRPSRTDNFSLEQEDHKSPLKPFNPTCSGLKKYLDEKEIFRMDHYLAKTLAGALEPTGTFRAAALASCHSS